ncbi:MAG TPA: hypothetical protein PL110_08330 [Candidatus Eremiobacteraeota bacterium]|nr:MAG: hypothetical protein BWY64_02444 [bacterium ADurb.Bin363]HPZ08107.1 hypothetical protein [Candidatus Eremiobacteraeota bacterium]
MSDKSSSEFDIKIYIDKDGQVTITSLFKNLLPLVKELSGMSGKTFQEDEDEYCS